MPTQLINSRMSVTTIALLIALAAQFSTAYATDKTVANSINMRFVRIPAGEFLMGAAESDDFARDDEKPQHLVRISAPFYMGAYEVTVGQFRTFVNATGYKTAAETDGKGTSGYNSKTRGFEYDSPNFSWRRVGYPQSDAHPVVNVSWYDACEFCKWLSDKEARTYRLPTEAEWEYACRAGTTARFVRSEKFKDVATIANLRDASLGRRWDTSTVKKYGLDPQKIKFAPWDDDHAFTATVGSFQPNRFGLYDMLGNAGEFCQDGYKSDYYQHSPPEDPKGPAKKQNGHVVRGGTFLNRSDLVRASSRVECPDTYRNYVIGFRVVLEARE